MRSIVWLVLACVSCACAAVPGAPPAERALALDVWEDLTERFQDDLARLAERLRARDFAGARAFFAPGFRGEVALGGEAKADLPAPFAERTAWKRAVRGKPELTDAAGCMLPLESLLGSWRSVDHVAFGVPQALFYDRDGKKGAARAVLTAGGRDAQGRPVALTLQWDLCLGGQPGGFLFECLTMRTGELVVAPRPLFADATRASGLARTGEVDLETTTVARGVAAGDADGDGWADLYLPGPGGGLRLARANGYQPAGVPAAEGTAALLVDLDNDGDQDLVVGLAVEPGVVLHENVEGAFRERGAGVGLAAGAGVQALTCADFDGNGLLDLFAARSPRLGASRPDRWTGATNGLPGRLFLQIGPLQFRECAAERGLAGARWDRAAAAADADGDGDVDLFVARDFGPDSYFENDGTSHFTDRAAAVGLADGGRGAGADWGDWDGDGALDLLVSGSASLDMVRILGRLYGARPPDGPGAELAALSDGNGLYLRRRSNFQDARRRAGVCASGWATGGGFLDVDNDGRLDVFSVAGCATSPAGPERETRFWRQVTADTLAAPAPGPTPAGILFELLRSGKASLAGAQRDRVFWNADKATGLDVSALSGADHPGDGGGAAFLDHGHDGDTDIVVHDRAGPRLLENMEGASNGWLRLVLVGTESNRDAIGARVRVRVGRRVMTRAVSCGSGFASAHDRTLLVGMGAEPQADAVDVYWPSGVIEHHGPFAARTSQRLVEGNGELGPAKFSVLRR